MKTGRLAVLITALALCCAASAQENSTASRQHTLRTLTVAGKVSTDGKSIFTDIDSEWSVSNAEILKGHEGRMVTVKCYVDTDKNVLQVLTLKPAKHDENYAYRPSDSAFRR